MRLLITGGSGYLGGRLLRLASSRWTVFPTFYQNPIDHPNAIPIDLRDAAAVTTMMRDFRPDVVIHQAISNRNPEHVRAIVPGARHIVEAAAECGARLIHVSTDLVFDGRHPPYDERAPLAPVNPYGAAKAEAEGLIRGLMPEALIVRPSLIYGFDPIDRQTGWLVDGIRRGETVRLFVDEIRCPIWVDTLAEALLELAEGRLEGIVHVAGPEPLNRWEFGQTMLSFLNISPGSGVVRGTIGESGLARPRDLTLDVSRAQRLLKTRLLTVPEAFAAAS